MFVVSLVGESSVVEMHLVLILPTKIHRIVVSCSIPNGHNCLKFRVGVGVVGMIDTVMF